MENYFQTKISNLENQGMYTEAFYSYYFKAEHLAREVIKNGKAKIYAENLTQEISKILKKNIDITDNNLEKQYQNKLKSFFKNKEYKQREFLNINDLIDVLNKNKISIEEDKIKNILQSSKKGTARELRNKLVHSNKDVSKSEYEKFKKDFNCVISLFEKILKNDLK